MARKNEQESPEVATEGMVAGEVGAAASAPAAPAAAAPAIDPAAFAALIAKVDTLEKQVQSLTLRLRHTV